MARSLHGGEDSADGGGEYRRVAALIKWRRGRRHYDLSRRETLTCSSAVFVGEENCGREELLHRGIATL